MAPLATHSRQRDREARRAETAARLRTAAEKLFDEGLGFSQISIDKLCAAAGITRTTYYVYFENKADVLLAWFDEIAADGEDAVTRWCNLDAAPSRSEFRDVMAEMLARHRPHADVLTAVYESSLFDSAVDAALVALVDGISAKLAAHIERGQRGGWIDTQLPPSETATWFVWMMLRGHQAGQPRDEGDWERLVATFSTIVFNILYLTRPA